MNKAPHSDLRTVMDEHVKTACEKPEVYAEQVRKLAEAILRQTSTDAPDVFFEKCMENEVGEGIGEFLEKKVLGMQDDESSHISADTDMHNMAVTLSNRAFEAHHATVQAFKDAQQRGNEAQPTRKAA